MDPIRTKLILTAVTSRFALIILSIIFNFIFIDHDANVFQWSPTPVSNSTSWPNTVVEWTTSGLTRWDGQYFLHIANNGYSYENTLAFFPLYPACVRVFGEFTYWLQVDYGLINFPNALKLGAVLFNVICVSGATLMLFDLSVRVLHDDYLAYKAALFYLVNPASIFFTATYSEALYSFLTFYALVKLEKGFTIKMGLAFAMATACRSNAMLNVGFVFYKGLRLIMKEVTIHKRLRQLERSDLSETVVNIIGDGIVPSVLTALLITAPFCLFQWYAFTQFCGLTKPKNDYDQTVIDYAINNHLRLPSATPSEWCDNRLPLAYHYIQSHYWHVGFMNYFEFKQIPNFILAMPILVITLKNAYEFLTFHKFYALRLGCTYFSIDPAQKVPKFNVYISKVLPKECFVYVIHVTFLALFSFFFIHVQVSTRMILSSSPVFYWIAALLTLPKGRKPVPSGMNMNREIAALKLESKVNLESAYKNVLFDEPLGNEESKWLKGYCAVYVVLGTFMFSNHLPWT